MQLLLVSLGLGALEKVLATPAVIGFVPTAGEPYEDPYFVKDDRRRLETIGYRVVDIDITNTSTQEIASRISSCDALFVAGGNTFYLMQQIRAKSVDVEIKNFISSGRLYVGASAGAAICGPSIAPFSKLDDPSAAPHLATRDGLGIIEFVILPHYGKPKHLDLYHSIMADNAEAARVVPLRDDEALLFTSRDRYERRPSALIFHT